MKEYKIVATRELINPKTGEKKHMENVMVILNSKYNCFTAVYIDYEKAKKWLELAKKQAAEYENERNENLDAYSYIVHYTDIRLQSREVTEWKDN